MADGTTINNILDYFLVLKIVIEHTGCSSNEKVIIGSGDVERLVGDAYNALGTNELEWQHFYHLVLFIFLLEAVLSQRGGGRDVFGFFGSLSLSLSFSLSSVTKEIQKSQKEMLIK
jgi:hypothetical protein